MNTKKFDVQYDGATVAYTNTLELRAVVHTDVTFHHVRQRMGTSSREHLWIDNSRYYTPEQEDHVRKLFTHYEPIARECVNKWLVAHNFPTMDKLTDKLPRITMSLSVLGEVTSFGWSER